MEVYEILKREIRAAQTLQLKPFIPDNMMEHMLKGIDAWIFRNEPMKNHTTFKVGGPADIFVMPGNTSGLLLVLQICHENNLPYFVIGNGSNLLVRDGGIRGVVISLKSLTKIRLADDNRIYAQAGVMMPDLSKTALEYGLAGLEFAEGIPGSIGGGVAMNAGAYGGEIKDIFCKAKVIDKNLQLIEIDLEFMDFGYRKSVVQEQGYIVCGVTMQLAPGDKVEIAAKMADFRGRRQEKQPLEKPSAGSTFKRPPGHFAGKLIMDAGLQGFSIGGAQVSEKHCGFVINKGDATAADILELIQHVQHTVKDKFGVMLETEVKVLGE